MVDKPNQADNVLISATYAINSDEERISFIEFALLSHPSSSSTALAGAQLSMLPISLKKTYPIKFLQGEYFRQVGNNEEAIRHWFDILNHIPADSDQARPLRIYISKLEKAF